MSKQASESTQSKKLVTFSTAEKTYIQDLAKTLSKQVARDLLKEKYAGTADVLKLVGMGAFAAATLAMPGLPRALKPFVKNPRDLFSDQPEPWERFNIKALKQTLKRLEKQKLVKFYQKDGVNTVVITNDGRRQILKYSLDTIEIKKPRRWDGNWRLVTYDVPNTERRLRDVVKEYLEAWGFYPFQESVYLHAYPCEKEVAFLREYLGVGKYLRMLTVSKIENDQAFRKFFNVL